MLKKISKFLLDYHLVNEETLYQMEDAVSQASPILSKDKKEVILSFVLGKSLAPQAYFFAINQAKKVNDLKVDFKFQIENQSFNENDVLDYLSFYFEKVLKNQGVLLKIFQRVNFCFLVDNKIHLKFNNTLEKDLFEPYVDTLQKVFHSAGFLGVSIICDVSMQTAEIELHRQQKQKELAKKDFKEAKAQIENQLHILNKITSNTITKIENIITEENKVIIYGQIFDIVKINGKKQKIYEFAVTDYTDSLWFTIFPKENSNITLAYANSFKIGDWVKLEASVSNNKYRRNELTGIVKKIIPNQPPAWFVRKDEFEKKRIEFSFHSKMTAFDGICDASEYAKFLDDMGYSYGALTDTSSVQAYPEIHKKIRKSHILYGLDCEIIPDEIKIVVNANEANMEDATYVILDLETTGLYPAYDEIIEFGAVKVQNNRIIDRIDFFIKPKKPIPDRISTFTKITNDLVADAVDIKAALKKIVEWVGDSILVAHNGIEFDFKFIQTKLFQNKMPLLSNVMLDTLRLSWAINPEFASHSQGNIARKYYINYNEEEAHRADADAEVLKDIYFEMNRRIQASKIITFNDLNKQLQNYSLKKHYRGAKSIIYAKNQSGIKAIYNLVSKSLTTGFYDKAKITEHELEIYRKDLLVTSSPGEGLVLNTALTSHDNHLENVIKKYDFILVVPPNWSTHLVQREQISLKQLEDATKRIIALSKDRLTIASSDAYYLHPWQHEYHHMLLYVKALGGKRHRFYRHRELQQFGPIAHYRTTQEMLHDFRFLKDEQLIQDVVINNAYLLINQFSENKLQPVKNGLHTPKIANADENLESLAWKTAEKWYGKNIPNLIKERISYELESILGNGYGIVYWIAHLLVTKSNAEGYLVGSRGSVGSSLIATLTGISEINPLPPHYWCAKCQRVVFKEDVDDGFDLPDTLCECGAMMSGEGHNIPFATFMGFAGNKVPDIDLNFSGEYQPHAHNHIRELFGEDHTLRAGTIATVADKTAFGYVRAFFEETGRIEIVKNAELNRYAKNLTGIKRTTGQHPGGIMVFPKDSEFTDFTPYNYPADDTKSDWKTTHFAFEYLHDNLLKLDILGHDDPTMLRMLRDITGIDPIKIPHHDPAVMNLFVGLDSLKISSEALLGEKTGAIGIPEFGTEFVRRMLNDTKPQSFADLIRISGLSHGINVWINNAQELIKSGLTLRQVITCRDDIMVYLSKLGVSNKDSFEIMESVRKGKGLTPSMITIMNEKKIPSWYIQSCQQIEYMFPKAHAAAYVLMAWRIAWYKIHHPLEYYATLFSIKLTEHDIATCVQGKEAIRQALHNIRSRLADKKTASEVKTKEIDLIVTYEAYLEMRARGFEMSAISLEHSYATKFRVLDKKIIPPFTTVAGLGDVAAESIIKARDERMFSSIKDLADRTKLTKTHLAELIDSKVVSHLPSDDQLKLF
ncbi:PolC-type DNA polymerase III [[Mycoplasma] testudinis]|uniref:PolC-type DNA polymerase III n=1 Tax=[Mycoplasma] testudinis TaxID=33924 RepID=UPI0005691DAE|nr:PolC-type DNA polymerase III [[Mycoplasma] testudinis]